MFEVSVAHDFNRLASMVDSMSQRHLPIAAVAALTRTAFDAQKSVLAAMPEIFDRPTPTTAKSLLVRPAKLGEHDPVASVFVKDFIGKGVAPQKFLAAEIIGGKRRDKRSEVALKNAGILLASQQAIPGGGAELDQYGNIPGGQITSILSRLSAFGEVGYRANASDKTKAKFAKAGKAENSTGTDLFVMVNKRTGIPIGVFKRGTGRHNDICLLRFTNKPANYRTRLDLQARVQAVSAERFHHHMLRALADAIRNGSDKGKWR